MSAQPPLPRIEAARACLAAFYVLLAGLASGEVSYFVSPEPHLGTLRVRIELSDPRPREEFRIPAWCPGFYVLRNYERKIEDVRAVDAEGRPLPIRPSDRRGWWVENPSRSQFSLSYRVRGDDAGLGFFGVRVDPSRTFVNGPAAFLYVEGRAEEPVRVRLDLPDGWDVATSLEADEEGWYRAESYDELIDSPFQLGEFERHRFRVGLTPFEAVFVSRRGTFRADLDHETRVLERVSREVVRLFGPPPFERYVFILHLAVGDFAGGLEHRSGTVLALPDRRPLDSAHLAAHELLHVWNGKHLRPRALGPFDYRGPNRTRDLWFVEGVTDYLAYLVTYRAGFLDRRALLEAFEDRLAAHFASRTRRLKTLEEVSWEAWEHGGFGQGDLNYYVGGLVAGLLLDAALRARSHGTTSLESFVRDLFEGHRLPRPGYEEGELRRAFERAGGPFLADLYDRSVRSTSDPPYELLREIGLRVLLPGRPALSLGYRLEGDVVVATEPAAAAAGLRPGDRIVAIDGRPFGPEALQSLKAQGTAGAMLYEALVERQGTRFRSVLPLEVVLPTRLALEFDPFASEVAQARRSEWLATP